jgi:hypothetical protein
MCFYERACGLALVLSGSDDGTKELDWRCISGAYS